MTFTVTDLMIGSLPSTNDDVQMAAAAQTVCEETPPTLCEAPARQPGKIDEPAPEDAPAISACESTPPTLCEAPARETDDGPADTALDASAHTRYALTHAEEIALTSQLEAALAAR